MKTKNDSNMGNIDETVDGPNIAAQIIAKMSPDNREKIVTAIQKNNPTIADKIEDKLYDFNKIAKLSPHNLQKLVQQVEQHDLALSLRASNEDIKEIFFSNMSERKKQSIQDEMFHLPLIQPHQYRAAQRRILNKAEEIIKGQQDPSKLKEIWA